jgi:UDPglucose 6-dehydrogenase
MKKIAIIGTGYVGLVSGAGLAEFGNKVICADSNNNKIDQLKSGKIPIYEPGLKSLVEKNVKMNRIAFSTDVERAICESEIIFIAVGTPSDDSGAADLSAVEPVSKIIAHNLNNYKIVCTKSTVPVGTGDWITKIIKKRKLWQRI